MSQPATEPAGSSLADTLPESAGASQDTAAAPLRTWTSPRLWRNLLLFWTAHSLVFAQTTLSLSGAGPTPADIQSALRLSLGTWLPWVPMSVFVIWLVQQYPIGRKHVLRSIAALCAGNAAVILAKAACVFAFNDLVQWYDFTPTPGRVLTASLFNNLLLYWLVVGAAHALLYSHRYWQREAEVAALRASLSEARLQALSAQLNPHFLFNTLNTVAELVHHDAAAADRMLANLSALLRRSLGTSAAQEVPLRDELAMLEQYLAIQRVRFGARLQSAFAVDAGCLDAAVPFLLLQPLVENAIVHAIAPRIEGGCVRVSAGREGDGRLRLCVSDDGAPARAAPAGNGIGLRNTADRLHCLYGEAGVLELAQAAGGGLCVTLTLPWRHAAGAPP
ncbi:sensor histidine kinase [Tahibacter harae]|uniref:Histidine kinase n=1 Tax=Tahibacter harae TaxID=2963937 RepID=A0ABT1QLD0_9GAMM|nr:histidine kinase [Tahibacter harae]MCQ4163328.1 histidine kinase [Tahibacter harae]